jgi:hypothetical protein
MSIANILKALHTGCPVGSVTFEIFHPLAIVIFLDGIGNLDHFFLPGFSNESLP